AWPPQDSPSDRDVLPDTGSQGVDRRKPHLGADPTQEGDRERVPVEVGGRVEEVGLDGPGFVAERRAHADVDHRERRLTLPAGPSGVYAVCEDRLLADHDVGCRESERPAPFGAPADDAADRVGPPEQAGRALDITPAERVPK